MTKSESCCVNSHCLPLNWTIVLPLKHAREDDPICKPQVRARPVSDTNSCTDGPALSFLLLQQSLFMTVSAISSQISGALTESNAPGPVQKTKSFVVFPGLFGSWTRACSLELSMLPIGSSNTGMLLSTYHLSGLRLKICLRRAKITGSPYCSFSRRLPVRMSSMSCVFEKK